MLSQWDAAARLVRRTGFGARGADVDAVLQVGPARYVASILRADPEVDPGARATPIPWFPHIDVGGAADQATRDRLRKQRNEQLRAMAAWWVRRMVAVQAPFGEKLTFCWHNHFATSAEKVREPRLMLAQNAELRRLARGDFRSLAYAMLTDAAMLRWLDGEQNTSKAPNENLSREFMELFTLGHGDSYTEADVREGARALTGWRASRTGGTEFRPDLHDNGAKTVLGVTGNLYAAGFCDAALAVPGSARYIVTRMWRQLVSDTPPTTAVRDRLVAAYGPGRNLRAMLEAMLTVSDFADAQGSIVVTPVEWLIGVVRALRVPVQTDAAAAKLAFVLQAMGQLPFYPPSVGGWPSGQAWLSTAAVDLRLQVAASLAARADLSALDGSAPSRVDAVAHLLGIGSLSPRSSAVLRAAAGNPQRLVTLAVNTPEYLTN